jgi:hypothetical protein
MLREVETIGTRMIAIVDTVVARMALMRIAGDDTITTFTILWMITSVIPFISRAPLIPRTSSRGGKVETGLHGLKAHDMITINTMNITGIPMLTSLHMNLVNGIPSAPLIDERQPLSTSAFSSLRPPHFHSSCFTMARWAWIRRHG